jgi:hypothetical protein
MQGKSGLGQGAHTGRNFKVERSEVGASSQLIPQVVEETQAWINSCGYGANFWTRWDLQILLIFLVLSHPVFA